MLGVPLSASPVKVGIIVAREISKEEQEKQAEQGWLATCVKAHCSSLVNRSFCNPNHPPKHTQHKHTYPRLTVSPPLLMPQVQPTSRFRICAAAPEIPTLRGTLSA